MSVAEQVLVAFGVGFALTIAFVVGLLACVVVCVLMYRARPGCLGRGRLTRLMQRATRRRFLVGRHIVCGIVAQFVLTRFVLDLGPGFMVWYFLGFMVPAVDDWLTHDGGRFRRWFSGRNRARWRMRLPAPAAT